MNAPDKIYVKEFDGEISQMWSGIKATKTTANAQHEYIRKDALREWAKEKNKMIDPEDVDYSLGYVSAMIDLIEKINAM